MFIDRRTPSALLAVLTAFLFTGCEGKPDSERTKRTPVEDTKDIPKDPLAEARQNIASGTAVMVDVRSQQERDAGHLDGSIFLPITQIKERAGKEGFSEWAAGKLPKGKIVYIH